jgi:predicted CXXCH cytochrome family protein
MLSAMRSLLWIAALTSAAVSACDGDKPDLQLGVSVAEHTKAYFPIADGEIHAVGLTADNDNNAPISCDACHAGTNTFAQTVCIKCHQNDATKLEVVHRPVAGFQLVDDVCLTCHADGKRGSQIGVDAHSELFFKISATDPHGDANPPYAVRTSGQRDRCATCHADPDNRSLNKCVECHALDTGPSISEGHAADFIAPLFSNDNASCKACHADTPLPPQMNITAHASIFAMDHHAADGAPAFGIDCVHCHDQHKSDPQAWAIDFDKASCVGCHIHDASCTLATQGNCH